MTIVIVIQARMGSTRLPGKVLLDIAGRPMLERVVERVRRCRNAGQAVVATTTQARDEAIVAACGTLQVPVVRGSEDDVLDRYIQAARAFGADVVVRVTADCPLLDPDVTDGVIAAFLAARPDYASNTLKRTYPLGLDTEVVSMAALENAWREATEPAHRVHVTPYLYLTPGRFRLLPVAGEDDHSGHRWTVDAPEDLELVRAVYDRLGTGGRFGWRDVLDLVRREPALRRINAHVEQKKLVEC
jgi:spore coat polysaccharide biosynthesis protein SpsF